MSSLAPFVRIALRIVGGFLIGQGWLTENDAALFETEEIIGVTCLLLSEAWYALAKWRGGAT